MSVIVNEEGTIKDLSEDSGGGGSWHFYRLLDYKNVKDISGASVSGTNSETCSFMLNTPTDFTNIKIFFVKIDWSRYDNNTYTFLKYSNRNQIYSGYCPEYGGSVSGSTLYYTRHYFAMSRYNATKIQCTITRSNNSGGTYNIDGTYAIIDCIYVA